MDLIGLIATIVLGLASLALAVAALPASNNPPTVPPSTAGPPPTPGPPSNTGASATPSTLSSTQVARLHEADVSLFTEVLGEPGYRRAIMLNNDKTTPSREWGWARTGDYMVRAVVDKDEQVQAYSITTFTPNFQPDFPYLAGQSDLPLRLGATTFDDFASRAFDEPLEPIGREGNIDSKGWWTYSEVYGFGSPLYRSFVMIHGINGALGQGADDDAGEGLDSFDWCPDQPCLGKVKDAEALQAAREMWPVTTVTVLGSVGPLIPEEYRNLTTEPHDDDIAAADRG